jgi:hypothetical protein
MPAVSEFTKATLHQRGMAYGQISTNLGLSKGSITAISTYYLLLRDGCGTIHAIMRKWKTLGRWFGVQVLEEGGCRPWNRTRRPRTITEICACP